MRRLNLFIHVWDRCISGFSDRRLLSQIVITGEKTLPVLEAAHIKPYSEQGLHEIQNGGFFALISIFFTIKISWKLTKI